MHLTHFSARVWCMLINPACSLQVCLCSPVWSNRQRVGVSEGADILAEVNSWPHERRVRGHAIIAEVEDQVTHGP